MTLHYIDVSRRKNEASANFQAKIKREQMGPTYRNSTLGVDLVSPPLRPSLRIFSSKASGYNQERKGEYEKRSR